MSTYFVIAAAAVSLLMALGLYRRNAAIRVEDARMKEIAGYIHDGAMAYLKRQYVVMAVFAAVMFVVLLVILGLNTALCFLVGALFSMLAGFCGMMSATLSNVRTAQSAKKGMPAALNVAFSGGAVLGLCVVGLGALGLAVLYLIFDGNNDILTGFDVTTEVLPIEEAKKKGAVAMFGEKYGDTVRVVEMGENGTVSMEFCGGTHVFNTAQIGSFRILSESSIASGVRRIEAITGPAVLERLNEFEELISKTAGVLHATSPAEVAKKAEQTLDELKEARRVIEQYKAKESAGGADDLLKGAKDMGGLKVIAATVSGDANALRKLGDVLRDKDGSVVALLTAVNEGKITLLATCGKDAVAKGVKAGDIIKAIAPIVGGKGGGKPDSAMGGGSDLSKLDEALAALEGFVSEKLG